jgi:hypothetical protein
VTDTSRSGDRNSIFQEFFGLIPCFASGITGCSVVMHVISSGTTLNLFYNSILIEFGFRGVSWIKYSDIRYHVLSIKIATILSRCMLGLLSSLTQWSILSRHPVLAVGWFSRIHEICRRHQRHPRNECCSSAPAGKMAAWPCFQRRDLCSRVPSLATHCPIHHRYPGPSPVMASSMPAGVPGPIIPRRSEKNVAGGLASL